MVRTIFAVLAVGNFTLVAADDPPSGVELPRVVDEVLRIELFASDPQLRTPTGMDVDHAGRVWAIESNTHFRPEGYAGHASDRVLVMRDTDRDGRADKIITFTDGLKFTMSVAVRPVWLEAVGVEVSKRQKLDESSTDPLQVFLATRAALFLYEDLDGDLKADRHRVLVRLETKGDYPHNGLAGFAFDAMGWMYFGFGENLGEPYRIIGSDGTTLAGGGEGGNLYRCRPDGSQLRHWATGFWNPHASCVDAFGRLFTVDNDPDSRPPCRLLHIIEGGDYGYRYRNGRRGLHPFTSWNGEIPGTLPMVAGTGEAPSGIVAYESDGLPDDYLGNLLVTSWGDHRIERFRLKPKGASFESLAEPIIQGGENFRPVGLALAPDGSLYCTDWVLKDYELHGKGRVWRIAAADEAEKTALNAATILQRLTIDRLKQLLQSPRLDIRRVAAHALLHNQVGRDLLKAEAFDMNAARRMRAEAHWAFDQLPIVDFHSFSDQDNGRRTTTIPREEYTLLDAVPFAVADLSESARGPLPTIGSRETNFHRQLVRRLALKSDDAVHVPLSFLSNDPFLFSAELRWLSHFEPEHGWISKQSLLTRKTWRNVSITDSKLVPVTTRQRLGYLLAAKIAYPHGVDYVRIGLDAEDAKLRRAAVQWVAEEGLTELRPQVEAVLHSEPMSTDLLLATIAALEMLDGVAPKDIDQTPPAEYVLPLVRDENQPAAVRATALRLVNPDDPALTEKLYRSLLDAGDAHLQQEAVRTLSHSTHKFAGRLLLPLVRNDNFPASLRADAIAALTGRWSDDDAATDVMEAFGELALGTDPARQHEAIRASRNLLTKTAQGRATRTKLLRQLEAARDADPEATESGGTHRELAEQLALAYQEAGIAFPPVLASVHNSRPKTIDDWYRHAAFESESTDSGDPQAGRRVFFQSQGAACSRCHTVDGRGGNVGPDLSQIARTMDRRKLAESILEPSKEVSPQFTAWTLVTAAGKTHAGLIVHENKGETTIGDAEGRTVTIPTIEIVERAPQRKSLMPEKLFDRMTVGEFRDLLAYLETLR